MANFPFYPFYLTVFEINFNPRIIPSKPPVPFVRTKANNLSALKKDTVSFGSNNGRYKAENDNRGIETVTCLFRRGIDWKKFPEALERRFSKAKKVNLISHACSDGSEAYSMAIILIEQLGYERAKKFLPIQAMDIKKDMVDFAKSGYIELSKSDLIRLENLGIDPKKYFTYSFDQTKKTPCNDPGDHMTFEVKDELRELVKFGTGDVCEDLKKLKDKSNTVLFFRHALFHLFSDEQERFYRQVDKTLRGKSLLVLGGQEGALYEEDIKALKLKPIELFQDEVRPCICTYSKSRASA